MMPLKSLKEKKKKKVGVEQVACGWRAVGLEGELTVSSGSAARRQRVLDYDET